MSDINLASSEVIKYRFQRARAHLDRVIFKGRFKCPIIDLRLVAHATYDFNRALGLSAVKHGDEAKAVSFLEDACANLDTVLEMDLTLVHVTSPPINTDDVITAAAQILRGVLALPLAI